MLHRASLQRLFGSLLLASVSVGCGPTDLAENVENAGPIAGPFAVSRFFAASGFMGDGMLSGYLTADVDEHCKARPSDARGNCYRFVYRPGEEKWAGVYWQHPANNWGSQPGRSVATSFERVRFFVAAEYSILLPEGGGIDASCGAAEPCRPGLACEGGACRPAGNLTLGSHCLVAGECAEGAQCVRQLCVAAGTAKEGEGCGSGDDALCASGLRCGVVAGTFACVPEGAGDVGARCEERNDCRGGLTCKDDECVPRTIAGPFNFQVGGVAPTKAGLEFSDQIGVAYFPKPGQPTPLASPDWQAFEIDLTSSPPFDSLIGAFMWAVPFPDIDAVSEAPQAYLADVSVPLSVFIDDVVFE